MGLVQKTVGYVLRYAGGITIAGSMYRVFYDNMLPEEFIGGVIAGGLIYIMGDCAARREIAQEQLHLDKKLLDVQKKQVALLEQIVENNKEQ